MTEITAEGRVSATTTTVTDNKNGTILKPSANVPKKSVADDLVSTFSSPTAWLLVVALIVTWSAVAVVMFDLTDYKSYVGGITKLGSDPMKVIDEVVEVSTNWIHGAMSLLSDMITPDDDDDEGDTEHPLKRRGEAHPSKRKVMKKNTKETNERKSRDVKKAPPKEARKVKVTKAEEKTKKAAKPEKKVERAKKEIKKVEKAKPKAKSKEETPSKTESKDQFEFCRYVVDLYTHEDVSSERKPVVKPVQVKKEEPKKKPSQEPRKKLTPEIERSAKDKPKAGTSTAKPKAQKAAPPSEKEPVEKKPAAKPKETKTKAEKVLKKDDKPEKVVKKEVRTQKEKVPVHVENEKSKESEVVKEKASPSPTKKAQKEKTKTAKPEVEKQKSSPAQTKKVSQTKKEVKSSKAAEPVKALKTEEHKESKREKEKEKPAAVPRGKEPEAIKDEKSAKTEEKVKEVKPLPRAAEVKPTRSHPPTKTPPPTKAPLPKKLAEAEKTHAKEEKDLKSLKPTSSMPYFQCIFVDGSNGYSFTHIQSLSVIPKSSEKKTQSPGQ